MKEITFDVASSLLDYEADTGVVRWKRREPELFSGGRNRTKEQECSWWNTRYAGTAVGCVAGAGYLQAKIFDKKYLVHRLAWLLSNGGWPSGQIDHINGVRTDNRIANMRVVNNEWNAKNQKISTRNTSGFRGVCWSKRRGMWVAQITSSGTLTNLGFFETAEAAHLAYAREASARGFTDRHIYGG